MSSIKNLLSEHLQQLGMIDALSLGTVVAAMMISLVCAVIIYAVYRFFYKGVSYSENFGILLIMLTLVTSFVILCISSNIVLSLGMVGALSIVRFRAAIKEPLDVGFLFLSIAAGLTAGARLYDIAIIGTLIVCIIFALSYTVLTARKSYLLVIRYSGNAAESIEKALASTKKSFKSKILNGAVTELTYAVYLPQSGMGIADTIQKIDGVDNVVLVQYTQEA